MQNWKKLSLIFNALEYASVPVAHYIGENLFNIYFSSCDQYNRSVPYCLRYNILTNKVLSYSKLDIDPGGLGKFDENGIMPTSLVEIESRLFLYYIGWNTAKTVPFRNAIGLLVSDDNGKNFRKFSEGPILDRGVYDYCFVASNCVFPENGFFRMYYLSCDKWEKSDSGYVSSYNIKYAESNDAINWIRNGKTMIGFKYTNEYAISVPRVLKDGDVYKMWYSYRAGPHSDTYRIGFAESVNALDWIRKDDLVNFDVSNEGWDSEMICYPFVFDHGGKRYMLYNGNGYGRTGFGLAILEQD